MRWMLMASSLRFRHRCAHPSCRWMRALRIPRPRASEQQADQRAPAPSRPSAAG
jgi:hypothetical protein